MSLNLSFRLHCSRKPSRIHPTVRTASCRLFPFPPADFQPQTGVWDNVRGLPPGTRLKLSVTNGTEVTGTVVDTTPDSVVLTDNEPGRSGLRTKDAVSLRGNVTSMRSDVAEVMVVAMARRYVARGETDITAVRHVVTALGIGNRVDVNTANERVRARIQSIDRDSFMVVRGSSSEQIAYQDVREVKSATMRGYTKALIAVGAAFGAAMLAYGIALRCGC